MGAKDHLLKNPTVFHEHRHSELPVGKVTDAEVDDKGLLVTVEFTKAEFANDLWSLITEGIVDRFSIGGKVLDSQEVRDESGNIYNEITKLELFEVSIVGLPANPAAKFTLVSKSFNQALTEEIDKKEGRKEMAKEDIKKESKATEEVEKSEEETLKVEETEEETQKLEETSKEEVKEEVKDEAIEKLEEVEKEPKVKTEKSKKELVEDLEKSFHGDLLVNKNLQQ